MNGNKKTHGGSHQNLPDMEEPLPIWILTKAEKFPEIQPLMSKTPPPGFTIQMDFAIFNVESIRGFTSNFLAICSATSNPFGFTSRTERPNHYILKFLVTTLMI